jgi:hypothetical protein
MAVRRSDMASGGMFGSHTRPGLGALSPYVQSPTRTEVRSPTRTSSDVRSPTRTSTEVRSPTSTSTEVRSPTSTSTEVRSPTSTSTDAYTSGNVTVTGGAGDGATTSVTIYTDPKARKRNQEMRRADERAHLIRSRGAANRMPTMIRTTMAPRAPSPMPAIMRSTSASRPGAGQRGALGLWGSQARPGMKGESSLGSLGECSMSGPAFEEGIFAGDSLGAQVYRLEPTGDVAFDTENAQRKLDAYGAKVAAMMIAGVKRLPAASRLVAMKTAMDALDPKLYDRARTYAESAQQAGLSAQLALSRGIARAAVEGFMDQLNKLGTKGPAAIDGLGLICGAIPGTGSGIRGVAGPDDLGIWGLSWVADKISSVFTPVASGAASASATITGGVKSILGAVKDATCGLLQGGGAQAAAQVAQSAPSPQTVGVAAGAAVASSMCGGQTPAPVGPTYVQPSNTLPIMIAVGAAGLVVTIALLSRRK